VNYLDPTYSGPDDNFGPAAAWIISLRGPYASARIDVLGLSFPAEV